MAAPIVVAKGAGPSWRSASSEIAREHGVPIVENVAARARALQRAPKSATRFPAALFGAVAEVLAYLVRIKQLML